MAVKGRAEGSVTDIGAVSLLEAAERVVEPKGPPTATVSVATDGARLPLG